jgi:uncharacterized protein (DUF2141 family)
MSKIFFSFLFSVIFFSASAALKIVVKGVQIGKGNVVVELYDNKTDFLKKPSEIKSVAATSEDMIFSFDIPDGAYAVILYQDINLNKVMDRNMFHIPKEPYGLSNNFKPHFGPPSFADCKFLVADQTTITIQLH